MANPFVKAKTTIFFDGWVLMVNGRSRFYILLPVKKRAESGC